MRSKRIVILATIVGLMNLANTPNAYARRGESEVGDDRGNHQEVEDSGHRNRGGSRSSSSSQRSCHHETELNDDSSSSNSSLGQASFRLQNKNKKNERRFKITVKIPFGNTLPVVNTVADAAALNVSAVLSRGGAAYAACNLVLDNDRSLRGVEFKVDLRSKKNRMLRAKKGSCDLDLVTAGIQNGIPTVQAADTIVISEETAGVFLQGQF